MSDSPWYDIPSAAGYTRMSERTVYRAIAEGRLKASKPMGGGRGTRVIIHRDWLDAFLAAGAVTQLAPARTRRRAA